MEMKWKDLKGREKMMEEKNDFEIKDVSIDRYNIMVIEKEDPVFDEMKNKDGWLIIDNYAVSLLKTHLQGHMPISMQTSSDYVTLDEEKAKQMIALLNLK